MSNTLLTERYHDQIAGSLNCFDRIVITGSLPDCCHVEAMKAQLLKRKMRFFDYPNGKRGEDIPLMARIMTVCDTYDALRSKRPYKPAHDHLKTVDIIMRGDGRTRPEHFDPAVLAAFAQNDQTFRDIFETHTA